MTMQMNRLRNVATIIAVLVLSFACTKEQRARLAELKAVQEKVAADFKPADVTLNVTNSKHLTISIVNSDLNAADDATRQARARKAAQIASDSLAELEDVRVSFVKKAGGGGLTMTNTIASYDFKASEVRTAGNS